MKNDPEERKSLAVLMVRVRTWVCALPAQFVIEVMRPLPIQAVVGAPRFIMGMSIVRGEVTPVLAMDMLLGSSELLPPKRFVLVRVGERRAVLAVEEVLGTDIIDMHRLDATPGLLSEALPRDVARIGVLDRSVLVMLEAGRLLSEDTWHAMTALGAGEQ
ncbi:MAG: chemotaxis protein CheW [Polyangiaceae bacterium]|nr:chemotaxis protein CheW [Polyangiaceae bacterium]